MDFGAPSSSTVTLTPGRGKVGRSNRCRSAASERETPFRELTPADSECLGVNAISQGTRPSLPPISDTFPPKSAMTAIDGPRNCSRTRSVMKPLGHLGTTTKWAIRA